MPAAPRLPDTLEVHAYRFAAFPSAIDTRPGLSRLLPLLLHCVIASVFLVNDIATDPSCKRDRKAWTRVHAVSTAPIVCSFLVFVPSRRLCWNEPIFSWIFYCSLIFPGGSFFVKVFVVDAASLVVDRCSLYFPVQFGAVFLGFNLRVVSWKLLKLKSNNWY